MPIKILMPALSPTMTEGNLVKWHKKVGDFVSSGQIIAEIETDKATMEIEAVEEGTLAQILVPEKTDGVKVNSLLALLLEEGEKEIPSHFLETAPLNMSKAPGLTLQTPVVTGLPDVAVSVPGFPNIPNTSFTFKERIMASPLAKKIARLKNIDLTQIKGSGPGGRIVKNDIENYQSPIKYPPDSDTLSSYTDHSLSGMRKIIAKRLTESKQTVPHFYLSMDCILDSLLEARKQINASLEQKISINDFVIKAVAMALKKVPGANVSWKNGMVRHYHNSDLSIAVAIEGGLVTPIILSAENKSLTAISSEMKILAEKARAGKLMPEEYQGGSFSISNLGMFGVKNFQAIINPPQGCILAVGAGEQKPVIKDGIITIGTVMNCTLSIDHRVVDGALGAQFLGVFKDFMTNPLTMLV